MENDTMQRMLGYMRKAIQEFDMIQNGDRIAVGVSGGKDSLILLKGLIGLRRFIGIDYELIAITLDPCFGGKEGDYSSVAKICEEAGIEYRLIRTNIAEIVFDLKKDPNPCSLCARMRRGALHDAAKAAGCNKIALGHHLDDVAETFIMNLFNGGTLDCFMPVTYLSRKDIYMIRPMIFARESDCARVCRRESLPTVKIK